MNKKLVVIGGDAAGMSAASKVRRENPDWEIVVFERSPHTSYAACGIPYYIADQVKNSDSLIARTPETFIKKYNIQAKVNHEVLQIDPKKSSILVRNLLNGVEFWEIYDELLIATGAAPIRPDLPKINSAGVFSISTLQSGIEARTYMDENRPNKAIIVGGGYVGIEMAEALLDRHMEVTLIDRSSQLMQTLDPEMAKILEDYMREKGVIVRVGESLVNIYADEKGNVMKVGTDKKNLDAEVVILGIGITPRSNLAKEAGIELGEAGAILVNRLMQTSIKHIWAAGDCATSYHILKEAETFRALGTIANKQGLFAGSNISGKEMEFPGVLGTAISKFQDLEIARTGLSESEAKEMNLDYVATTIKSSNFASYYPGSAPIHVKLLARKDNKRLIGCQIVGFEGSAKRIDTIAAAIMGKLTPFDLAFSDLSYAPPFSGVWDAVQIAARRLL
ncbi:CoA-disulfide reductase [Lunatibacter salilacus]|uniref:CoA-disulfide reductase n=1 Tax=Lunatibacter salilacus TaxID=2483804 RepID=UPI00131C96F8|nr:CoA-disulfide reductase [Lunatibacter salilacus]